MVDVEGGVIVLVRNVIDPASGREEILLPEPLTVRGWLDRRGIEEFDDPTLCLHNGLALMRADWATTVIGPGDVCQFITMPAGSGGGGGGGSNPLRIVMTLAVIVAAYYFGPALATGMFGAEVSAGAIAATQAGLAFVGTALVSAVLPAPKPAVPSMDWASPGSASAPSPTYSLAAQGNQARLEQPIPEWFGRNMIVPDFAAAAYTEFAANEQYLFETFIIGQGAYSIETIRIDDTPIANFEEITTELVGPTTTPTLFSIAVVTAAEVVGQEMKGPNQLAQGEDGWLGPFPCSPSETRATHIGFDVVCPRGLYYAVAGGLSPKSATWEAEVRQIDDAGEPVGVWIDLTTTTSRLIKTVVETEQGNPAYAEWLNNQQGEPPAPTIWGVTSTSWSGGASGLHEVSRTQVSVSTTTSGGTRTTVTEYDVVYTSGYHSASTNTAIRLSFKFDVPIGRYEARMKRVDAKDTSALAGHELRWQGLRGYLSTQPNWAGKTVLLVKAKATDQLSQRSSRMVNVIATRKLKTWHPQTGWSAEETATRSIAWAAAHVCRSTNGWGLTEDRFDLAALYTMEQTWAARGDEFSGGFDTGTTVWDAVNAILRAGRAMAYQQRGIVRFVRDEQRTLPTAFFGPRNIVKGSFSLRYVLPGEETADAVEVSYWDDRTWKPKRVTPRLADSQAAKPAKVKLLGARRAQAWREGYFMASENRYRRRTVIFRTRAEAFACAYGDLAVVSHPMPAWGRGGDIIAWDAAGEVLTLSEPVEFAAGTDHYIGLRQRDNSLAGPFRVAAVDGAADQVRLLEDLDGFVPYTGADEERTQYAFGAGNDWARKVKIRGVKPRGKEIEVTAVVEDDRVHAEPPPVPA